MSGKDAISKEKGIEICVNMLYEGKQRADIVQHFAKVYGTKQRTVDNYIKEARPIKDARLRADEEVRARVQAEQTEEVAKKLGISREWMLRRLMQTIDLDWRIIYKEDGTLKPVHEWPDEAVTAVAGIETFEERTVKGRIGTTAKIKRDPRLTAMDMVAKLLGYYPQSSAKVEVNEPAGKGQPARKVSVTLILS